MHDFYNILTKIVLAVSMSLSLCITVFSLLRGKKTRLLLCFVIFQTMFAMLCGTELLRYLKISIDNNVYRVLKYFFMSFTTYSLLIFCLQFIKLRLNLYKHFLLALPSLAIFLLKVFILFANAASRENLPAILISIVSALYSTTPYFYVLGTSILLTRYCIKNLFRSKRKSIILVLYISLLTSVTIGLNILNLIFKEKFDTSKITNIFSFLNITLSSLIFSILTFKYRFLNIASALRKIVDSLEESVCFIDVFGDIVYYNKSFAVFFGSEILKNRPYKADSFCKGLAGTIKLTPESQKILNAIHGYIITEICGEIEQVIHQERYFSVKVHPLFNNTKEALGKVVSFNDITIHKRMLNEISDKNEEIIVMNEELTETNEELVALNEELSVLNNQLTEYAHTAEELATERERNRIARDSHDTIGHTMSKLITLLEVCCAIHVKNPTETHDKLMEAVKYAREGMRDIRRSIEGLLPEKLEADNLKAALRGLISDFLSSGIKINLTLSETNIDIDKTCSNVIFRICQEALTNSLRHGKAESVAIIVKQCHDYLELYIFDDGNGCKKIKKGFGLDGMEQRVASINGIIKYGSDGEKGFNIYVKIPLRRSG